MTEEQLRKKFEAWISAEPRNLSVWPSSTRVDKWGGGYHNKSTQLAWEAWLEAQKRQWQPIETAPKDGTSIIGLYEDGEAPIRWSERPVCMLGERCGGFPPGWATDGTVTDNNLPMDKPILWRPLPQPPKP